MQKGYNTLKTLEAFPTNKQERKKLFNAYDPNGNNLMSLAELDRMIKMEKIFQDYNHKSVIMRAYKKADKHGSKKYEGFITRYEFAYFLKYLQVYNDLWKAFDEFDQDDDMRVDREEFFKGQQALGMGLSKEEANSLFDKIDTNHGGKILFEEFSEWAIDHKFQTENSEEDEN